MLQFVKNRLLNPRGIFLLVIIFYVAFFSYFFYFDNTHYIAGFPIRDGSDGPVYDVLARNLLDHQLFSSASSPPFEPNTFRTPGYPFFIAGILFLFKSYIFVSFAQIILTALTAVMIYIIAKSMIPRAWAFIAALFYAFEFNTITLSINLLSETLFVFLIILAVYLLFFSRFALDHKIVFMVGILSGMAILVRPIGFFIPVLFLIFYTIVNYASGHKIVLRNSVLLIVGCAIIVLPWMARNEKLTGHFSLTSLGTYDLLFYNITYFLADKNHIPPAQVTQMIKQEIGIESSDNDEDVIYSDRISAVAFKYLKQYPLQYTLYHLEKEAGVFVQSSFAYFLNEAPKLKAKFIMSGLVDDNHLNINRLFTRGEYGQVFTAILAQPLLFLDRFRWIFTSLLMLVPFIIKRKDFFWQKLLFLSLILYLPFLGAPIGDVRYRVPAEPFMFILAVWGAWELFKIRRGTTGFLKR